MKTFKHFFEVSRSALAKQIADTDANLNPGTSSKDVRVQPAGNYNPNNFVHNIKSSGLELVRIAKPGEDGSTSGQLLTYIVKDESGREYPVVLGKGVGFGTRDEDYVITDLREQLAELISNSGQDYIKLQIDDKVYSVNGIESTKGTPKSDFHFTYNEQPQVYISHKAGRSAKDYQQYGGTTCRAGDKVCSHPEILSFVKRLQRLFPKGMQPKTSVYRPIKDEYLKQLAIFGNNYGEEFGVDNVNALYQGKMSIVKKGRGYILTANHFVYNGDLPTEPEYQPVLYGRYNPSRGGYHGIPALRTMIMPAAKLTSTTKKI